MATSSVDGVPPPGTRGVGFASLPTLANKRAINVLCLRVWKTIVRIQFLVEVIAERTFWRLPLLCPLCCLSQHASREA